MKAFGFLVYVLGQTVSWHYHGDKVILLKLQSTIYVKIVVVHRDSTILTVNPNMDVPQHQLSLTHDLSYHI